MGYLDKLTLIMGIENLEFITRLHDFRKMKLLDSFEMDFMKSINKLIEILKLDRLSSCHFQIYLHVQTLKSYERLLELYM